MEIEYRFTARSADDVASAFALAAERVNKIERDAADIASFAKRVRLPFSGRLAALYSRMDAWKRERIERRAQAAFERGWV